MSEFVSGADIRDALDSETVDSLFETMGCKDEEGLYVWSRRISPRNTDISTSSNTAAKMYE